MAVNCDSYNLGCNGGDFTLAWQYIQENGGAMISSSYPYVSGTTQTVNKFVIKPFDNAHLLSIWFCYQNGTCKFNSSAIGAKVSFYDWTMPYPNATVSMTYLVNYGPLPTAMKVLDSLFDYV